MKNINHEFGIQMGCAETLFDVPLFHELAGFGPWRDRRNLGVRDPLFCRALTLHDGKQRAVLIVTDMLSSNTRDCRLLRAELATRFSLLPQGILFIATHSHSSPGTCYPGYGSLSEECRSHWFRAVTDAVSLALKNEEPVSVWAGRSPIRSPLGENRADPGNGPTDPEIRWIKGVRADGSVKVLVHNHAMHGVVFGPQQKLLSGDWMGEANQKIKARKLADMPVFLYGCSGDINVRWTHKPEDRELNLEWITDSYVNDLESGLGEGREICPAPLRMALEAVQFPTESVEADHLRATAEKLRNNSSFSSDGLMSYIHARMLEMAVLAEKGHEFRVILDLQTIRAGDLQVYAVPGEPFYATGEALRTGSTAPFPLVVSVANGHGGYFPTRAMFEQNPTCFSSHDWGAFGFYEVWFGVASHRPKYKPEIIDFIVQRLLNLPIS